MVNPDKERERFKQSLSVKNSMKSTNMGITANSNNVVNNSNSNSNSNSKSKSNNDSTSTWMRQHNHKFYNNTDYPNHSYLKTSKNSRNSRSRHSKYSKKNRKSVRNIGTTGNNNSGYNLIDSQDVNAMHHSINSNNPQPIRTSASQDDNDNDDDGDVQNGDEQEESGSLVTTNIESTTLPTTSTFTSTVSGIGLGDPNTPLTRYQA